MALFTKRPRVTSETPRARMSAGRRLRTDQDVSQSFATLESVLAQHAPVPYAEMRCLHRSVVSWHGEGGAPSEAGACSYGGDGVFVVVFWPQDSGSMIGLFPLGGSEQELHTPLIGQWAQADPSLSSIGRFEPRLLSLHAPVLPDDYFSGILARAGFAATDNNLRVLAQKVSEMFKIKGAQFISSQDQRAATRFLDERPWRGDPSLAQQVLDDLDAWNPQLTPYIQDLPDRVCGLLLQRNESGRLPGDFWDQMT